MDPLSKRTRVTYLGLLGALSLVLIPLAILYASGYRLSSLTEFSFVPTGGVYISVPVSDALVSINGKEEGITNLFTRSFYIDSLTPGSYAVHVAREGSYPWYRTLIVEPGIVTDVRALLAPQQIEPVRLIRSTASSTASTTRQVARVQYDAYLASFTEEATSTPVRLPTLLATTTTLVLPDDSQGGFELYLEGGGVRLHWSRSTSTIPSVLCVKPSLCVKDFALKKGKEEVVYARFWGSGIVYTTRESGVYLAEIDVRPTPLIIPLYPRRNSDFRVVNGALIIKEGTSLYQIDSF